MFGALRKAAQSCATSRNRNFIHFAKITILNFQLIRFIFAASPLSFTNSRIFSFQRRRHFANLSQEIQSKFCFKNVTCDNDNKLLKVKWNQNSLEKLSVFPYVWLRDHCQCAECFHPVAQSRTMLFDHLRLDVSPISAYVISSKEIKVEWSDGHTSSYTSEWLSKRSFQTKTDNENSQEFNIQKTFWDTKKAKEIPVFEYENVLKDDKILLQWLINLEKFGFVLLENAPVRKGVVRELVERVTFVRRTHYGEEFTVKAKPDPSNVAYAGGPLQLHTDLPYYHYKPGVQLIHCIIQFNGEGAESLVADAQNVAHELKKRRADLYRVLADTHVQWVDKGIEDGVEFFKLNSDPIICEDKKGSITRVNFSHPQRDSFFDTNVNTVFKWYEAFKLFHNMLSDAEFCLKFKMKPGTLQTLDNLRVVHGRTSYNESLGSREIEGCYMDWDEVKSKRRVLQLKF